MKRLFRRFDYQDAYEWFGPNGALLKNVTPDCLTRRRTLILRHAKPTAYGAMEGTKYDLLAKNDQVGFEMECTSGLVLDEASHSCTMNYESVMGWGTVSEVTDLDGKLHALDCIMRQYHSEDFYYDPAVAERTRILCLKIQERTGKRRAKILGGNHHA